VVVDVHKAIKMTLLAFSSRVQSLYRPQRGLVSSLITIQGW